MFNYTKIGYDHMKKRTNCQDMSSVFRTKEGNEVAVICDGCGSTPYAEVGSILFARLFRLKYTSIVLDIPSIADEIFEELIKTLSNNDLEQNDSSIYNFLSFTILIGVDMNDYYQTYTIGDGYICALTNSYEFEYSVLEENQFNCPKYLGYKFVQNRDSLSVYKDKNEIFFYKNTFNKDKYQNIILASDGLRFIINPSDEQVDELRRIFEKIICTNTNHAETKKDIKEFIARNESIFIDDFSIALI